MQSEHIKIILIYSIDKTLLNIFFMYINRNEIQYIYLKLLIFIVRYKTDISKFKSSRTEKLELSRNVEKIVTKSIFVWQ